MPDLWIDVDTAVTVPVNVLPLLDDSDFKSVESAVAYNAAGLSLKWNFQTPGGTTSQTAVTPTTAGDYDWSHAGGGIYKIEIPASGGASINNDTEGVGFFSGVATGVLPWRGPTIGFRAAGLNDALVESAYSTTRGLAGTALPNAAAEAAGGLYTRGTGAGQINQPANGMVDANVVSNAGTAITSAAGVQEVKVASIATGAITAASIAADAITDAKVASDVTIASVTGAVGSVTGAVGSVTGNVGGNVTGSVGSIATGGISAASFAAGAIDAAAIAADAIGASELADSAVSEIQSGLSTLDAAAVATATQTGLTAQGYTTTRAGYLDTLNGLVSSIWSAVTRTLTAGTNIVLAKGTGVTGFTDLDAAGVRTAVGLASANLDTQLSAIAGYIDTEVAAILTKIGTPSVDIAADIAAIYAKVDTEVAAILAAVDTEVAAIKAKTDNLTFTSGTFVDANIQAVNDVTLTGTGVETTDEWRPA